MSTDCLLPPHDLHGFTGSGKISSGLRAMTRSFWGNSVRTRKILLTSTVFAALTFTQAAQAGGIGIREQSAAGQGMSFAGEGTSSMGLSGMFWNPAAVTQTNGFGVELHTAFLFGNTVLKPEAGTGAPLLNPAVYGTGDSGNI